MVQILSIIEHITDIGKSTKQEQSEANVSEIWHLWSHLIARYDVIERTQVLANFAEDPDLKIVLNQGIKILQKQCNELEKIMKHYGIPMPLQPPDNANSPLSVETITDRYIFRSIMAGIQAFLPLHLNAFTQSTSPKLREFFKTLLLEEINVYDEFVEYGKFKNWLEEPPAYRT